MKLVAIINITPDSFSDGGEGNIEQRIAQAIADGASVIDLGAESTRPNATLINHDEEWSRLLPVLSFITPASPTDSAMSLTPSATKEGGLLTTLATSNQQRTTILSIDTRHPETFRKALSYGAKWFNDVSGFQNPESLALTKECGCDVVLMHSLTVPADPKVTFPEGVDVVREVYQWAKKRIAELGIPKERIIFDPGIGFGKTAAQSWGLINNIKEFKALGVRIMVGHSRKSFLGGEMNERDVKTAEITRKLAENGVDYARVHNIAANRLD